MTGLSEAADSSDFLYRKVGSTQMLLGMIDTANKKIFIRGGAGASLEFPGQMIFAQMKMLCQIVQRETVSIMCIQEAADL